MYGHAFFAQKFLLDSLELKCLNFHHFRLHCRILKKIGDKVELLAAEMWTSHGQLFLCHQYTLPMLVKRVAEGGYMVSLELCCFGGAKRAGHQFFLATCATLMTVADCAMLEISLSRCLPGLLHLLHRSWSLDQAVEVPAFHFLRRISSVWWRAAKKILVWLSWINTIANSMKSLWWNTVNSLLMDNSMRPTPDVRPYCLL